MSVAIRLEISRVIASGTLSWLRYRLWARTISERNTVTGRPHRLSASRSSASPYRWHISGGADIATATVESPTARPPTDWVSINPPAYRDPQGRRCESKDRVWSTRQLGWAGSAALEDDFVVVLNEFTRPLLE
jgi:hypothetical protein